MLQTLDQLTRPVLGGIFLLWKCVLVFMLGWVLLEILGCTPLASLTQPLLDAFHVLRLTDDYHRLDRDGVLCAVMAFVLVATAIRGVGALCSYEGGPAFLRCLFILHACVVTLLWFGHDFRDQSYSECSRGSSIVSQLQTIRSQIELYWVQHNGEYPTLAQLQDDWGVMVKKTRDDGTIDENGDYGPYLQQPPENPFMRMTSVGLGSTGGWIYDEKTGSILAVVPPEKFVDYGLLETDAVPAGVVPDDESSVEAALAAVRAERARQELLKRMWGVALLLVPVVLLTWAFIRLHRMQSRMNLTPPTCGQVGGVLALLAVATAYLLIHSTSYRWDEFASFTFGGALMVIGLFSIVMFLDCDRVEGWKHADWFDPNLCRRCQYDLRGTLAANRCACPECGQVVALVD